VVRRVVAFCRSRGARATLVFDGRPFREELPRQELGPVALRFPEPGEDADTLIRRLIDAAARPAEITLVSSDRALYSYARTRGAAVLRAREWNALERSQPRAPQAARRAPASGSEKPEREADVEGWLRRFGAVEGASPLAGDEAAPAPSDRVKRRVKRVKRG
jgi:predicted RNA-binding protein with PIN domain